MTKVEVLPGEHTVFFVYSDNGYLGVDKYSGEASFLAEAGHDYQIDGDVSWLDSSAVFRVVDTTTGKVVWQSK